MTAEAISELTPLDAVAAEIEEVASKQEASALRTALKHLRLRAATRDPARSSRPDRAIANCRR